MSQTTDKLTEHYQASGLKPEWERLRKAGADLAAAKDMPDTPEAWAGLIEGLGYGVNAKSEEFVEGLILTAMVCGGFLTRKPPDQGA